MISVTPAAVAAETVASNTDQSNAPWDGSHVFHCTPASHKRVVPTPIDGLAGLLGGGRELSALTGKFTCNPKYVFGIVCAVWFDAPDPPESAERIDILRIGR